MDNRQHARVQTAPVDSRTTSPSATVDATQTPANVTVEFRPGALVDSTENASAIKPDSLSMKDLDLPASDDATAAAKWVAAGDCGAESNIKSVEGSGDHAANTTVSVTFDNAGPAELQDLTGVISKLEEARNQMAIVIDGKVASAPVVAEAIAGRQVRMVGSPNDPSLEALVASFGG